MRILDNRRLRLAALLAAVSPFVGCAGLANVASKLPSAAVEDVRPKRMERRDDVVREFEKQRNYAQFLAAAGAYKRGDTATCRRSLEGILSRDPKHRDALLLAAELDLKHGAAAQAVERLRVAAAELPADEEVRRRLAAALDAAGLTAEAQELASTATDAPEQEEEQADATATETVAKAASPRSADVETAADAWSNGDRSAAQSLLGRVLEDDPKHVEANILQAEIELADGETDAARQRLEHLVIRNPRNAQVRRACGLLYDSIGERDFAVACLAQAGALEQAEASEEPDGAVTVGAVEPIDTKRRRPATSPNLARPKPPQVPTEASAEVPTTLEADVFEGPKTRRSAADAASATRNDFIVALEAGDFDGAGSIYERMIRTPSATSEAATEAAAQALKFGQPETAEHCATIALKRFPHSAGLHRVQGTALYQLGRDAEAESALKRSLSLDNTQGLSYFLLGSVQTRLGKQSEAAWQFRQAGRFDRRFTARK